MDNYDIRLYIYHHLDINSLKVCFQIDHLSQRINNDYFWYLYFKRNNIIMPPLNDSWFKSYHVSLKTRSIISGFTANKVIFMELNVIIDNLFITENNNIALSHFKLYKMDVPFFYELRISEYDNKYNFFCVMIEYCYEGLKRGYHSLDINFNKDELYNVIYKLFYYTVNRAYVYTY